MGTTAQRVARIRKEIGGVEAQYGVTSWERTFLSNIEGNDWLSQNQEVTLRGIEAKVFGEEADDDE
jgi:hypothetical protein